MSYQPPVVGSIEGLQGGGLSPLPMQPYPTMNLFPALAIPGITSGIPPAPDLLNLGGESDDTNPQQSQIAQLIQEIMALTQELEQELSQGQDASQTSDHLQQDEQQLQALLGGSSQGSGGFAPMGFGGGGVPTSSGGGAPGVSGVSGASGGGSSSDASSTPQTSSATSGDAKSNAQIVANEARKLGVDPVTAVATMLVESGGNAHSVGDGGTSFGLFQLHQGGELGNMSPQQAFDPATNARVALSVFAQNKGRYSDPGQLAAASQRPADPQGYAQKVDAHLAQARQLLGAA